MPPSGLASMTAVSSARALPLMWSYLIPPRSPINRPMMTGGVWPWACIMSSSTASWCCRTGSGRRRSRAGLCGADADGTSAVARARPLFLVAPLDDPAVDVAEHFGVELVSRGIGVHLDLGAGDVEQAEVGLRQGQGD